MLHRSHPLCSYRASLELDRIRSMLRGRARLERKVGLKRLFFLMRTQTRYRVEQQSHWTRAIVRKNIDSAAREHGSGWPQLRNEFGRHNILLLPKSQQMLAQYEPLAFRAILELCASRIAPPPAPIVTEIPAEAYMLRPTNNNNNNKEKEEELIDITSHPAARVELRRGIERVLKCGPSPLRDARHGGVDGLMESWKEFDVSHNNTSIEFVKINK